MEKLAYTVPEAAEVLGLGVQAVYNLAHVPSFPAVRVGNRILIPCNSLARWLEAQTPGLEEASRPLEQPGERAGQIHKRLVI